MRKPDRLALAANIVGTLIAFLAVPLYVVLRQQWGAIGLAIASSVAILIYVLLLGWLQYRRFEWEAAARDTNLKEVPGMLGAALSLAVATGLRNRCRPLSAVLAASVPAGHADLSNFNPPQACAFVGIAIYLTVARLLGVTSWPSCNDCCRRLMRSR